MNVFHTTILWFRLRQAVNCRSKGNFRQWIYFWASVNFVPSVNYKSKVKFGRGWILEQVWILWMFVWNFVNVCMKLRGYNGVVVFFQCHGTPEQSIIMTINIIKQRNITTYNLIYQRKSILLIDAAFSKPNLAG